MRERAERGTRADDDEQDEREVAERPGARLLSERQVRFEKGWKSEERGEAPGVARGVEKVRVGGRSRARLRVPLLQERRARRECEERQTDRQQQSLQKPRDGTRRRVVRRRADERRGERRRGGDEQRDVQNGLRARRELSRRGQHVGVAREQHALEEQKAGVPDRRRPAEQRQKHLAHERLNPEEQERAQKERDGEQLGHEAQSLKFKVQSSKAGVRPSACSRAERAGRSPNSEHPTLNFEP